MKTQLLHLVGLISLLYLSDHYTSDMTDSVGMSNYRTSSTFRIMGNFDLVL